MNIKNTLLALGLVHCITCLNGQIPDLIKPDSIVFPVHKAYVGTIAFMGKSIPMEQFKSSDFLESCVLPEQKDLNIRVFMGNSLTNALHRLAPDVPLETLTAKGNFQFTFWVDQEKIYTENLHPGAFGAENKNKKTVFRIPLISSTNEDSWGRFLWSRFLMNGGQEALCTGQHLLMIEIRPYLKLSEIRSGEILAQGSIRLLVPGRNIEEDQLKYRRPKASQDWEIADGGVDIARIEALNRKIESAAFKDITSVVAIKNGKLALEEYFNGARRSTLHDTRSVGKSFASALLGIAVKKGYIANENQALSTFYTLKNYANYGTEKEQITLKQLLTMNVPLAGSDMDPGSAGNEENMYPSPNWVKFTLDLPLDSAKWQENHWDYFTAGVVVLGDVLQHSAPGGLETFAEKELFSPLGIANYKWQYTPQKVPNTAGGLRLRALDLAKFGQLYQNGGSWKGNQILSKDWVEKSLSQQSRISEDEYYGYLFWNKTYQVDGKAYEAYYASGNGGNRIIIFKDQPWVIVITAKAFNTPYGHTQVDKMVQQYLIPALR